MEMWITTGVRSRLRWPVLAIAVAAILIYLLAWSAAPQEQARYEIAVAPDGSRIAVQKWTPEADVEIFVARPGAAWTPLAARAGQRFAGGIAFAAQGDLLYVTAPRELAGPHTVWRAPLGPGAGPVALFERQGPLASLLPLRSGGLAFQGEVGQQARPALSYPGVHAPWRIYRWMLWQPGAGVRVLTSSDQLLTGPATLVRDEHVLTVSEDRLSRSVSGPPDYRVQALQLDGARKVPPETRLIPRGERQAPALECDWAGDTCAVFTPYSKDGYFAHRAQIHRAGTDCGALSGLPDRLERARLSLDGKALLMLTRDHPRQRGQALWLLLFTGEGCGTWQRIAIPLP
jgi:hypothetical protein